MTRTEDLVHDVVSELKKKEDKRLEEFLIEMFGSLEEAKALSRYYSVRTEYLELEEVPTENDTVEYRLTTIFHLEMTEKDI